MQYRAPRGTTDLLPEEQKYWRYIEAKAVDICRRHGFSQTGYPCL